VDLTRVELSAAWTAAGWLVAVPVLGAPVVEPKRRPKAVIGSSSGAAVVPALGYEMNLSPEALFWVAIAPR